MKHWKWSCDVQLATGRGGQVTIRGPARWRTWSGEHVQDVEEAPCAFGCRAQTPGSQPPSRGGRVGEAAGGERLHTKGQRLKRLWTHKKGFFQVKSVFIYILKPH